MQLGFSRLESLLAAMTLETAKVSHIAFFKYIPTCLFISVFRTFQWINLGREHLQLTGCEKTLSDTSSVTARL